jgi:predicted nucleotidyltransferase
MRLLAHPGSLSQGGVIRHKKPLRELGIWANTASMPTEDQSPPRRLPLKILDLEIAFESLEGLSSEWSAEQRAYLDLKTGEVVWSESEESDDAYANSDGFLLIPRTEDRLEFNDLRYFIQTVEERHTREELREIIQGRGAFRRFKARVYRGGDLELKHAWNAFLQRRLRQRIVDWLEVSGVEPVWDQEIFKVPELPNRRPDLLRAVLEFVLGARRLEGIRRIALLGSLATDKRHPKDVDLLVVVEDAVSLAPLAKLKRQLTGMTLKTGDSRGADVFMANPAGEYLGRICHWKECQPGIRVACEALHCGRRQYLYDDLQNLRLDNETVARPPIELWPVPGPRDSAQSVPQDVVEILLRPLRESGTGGAVGST